MDLLVLTEHDDKALQGRLRAALLHVGDDVLVVARSTYEDGVAHSHFWQEVDRDRVEVWSSPHG